MTILVRFGEEDNPDPVLHPCKGLFQTCCTLKSETSLLPKIEKKSGCGYRNHEGVGFRITGEKDNEAQYGKIELILIFYCKMLNVMSFFLAR